MTETKMTTHTETEQAALTRRLVERSGLSTHEASDAVDAYMHAESEMASSAQPSSATEPAG